MAADGGAAAARLRWELENQIAPATDVDLYVGDPSEQQQLQQQKPWAKDPHFFKQLSHVDGAAVRARGRARAVSQWPTRRRRRRRSLDTRARAST
jgi:hypothetical protein